MTGVETASHAVARSLRGWALRRWHTPTGNVGFIWRSPRGSLHRCSAQLSEREALRSAMHWWARRAQDIETAEGAR